MKIASWNVNSLRVRLPQVLDWLKDRQPDVLGLQETKLEDSAFPAAAFEAAGYQVICNGQKTYNGVALISKAPIRDCLTDLPGLDPSQRRLLVASIQGLRIINLYVPNGAAVGSDKYRYKLQWLETVTAFVAAELARQPELIILGDFNIAPEDRDVYDPEQWRGQILCSPEERARFRNLLALGLSDSFRLFPQAEGRYSWWDYRGAGFRRNHGLRIDHILASTALAGRCLGSDIDTGPRRLERPSDHAPVLAEFAL